MKLILFLSLTIVLIWQVQGKTTSRCPQFWVDATDVKMGCLWFNVKDKMAWEKAQDYCRTKNVTNGHLVEIYSQAFYKHIFTASRVAYAFLEI